MEVWYLYQDLNWLCSTPDSGQAEEDGVDIWTPDGDSGQTLNPSSISFL